MLKKIEKNEMYLLWILADLRQQVLFIPQEVKEKSKILKTAHASLYLNYKNRYPEFKEVIVTDGTLLYQGLMNNLIYLKHKEQRTADNK